MKIAIINASPKGNYSITLQTVLYLETKYTSPQNFYGVGGMKIFRDLIYQMRGMMRADHKFYKKRGIYDFPQKKKFTSLKMYLVGFLLGNEKILSKMGNKMNEGMLAPYKKIIEKKTNGVKQNNNDNFNNRSISYR